MAKPIILYFSEQSLYSNCERVNPWVTRTICTFTVIISNQAYFGCQAKHQGQLFSDYANTAEIKLKCTSMIQGSLCGFISGILTHNNLGDGIL